MKAASTRQRSLPVRENPDHVSGSLPHRIAVLCYIYDDNGNVLLLHRRKMPNAGYYSPIGGKLHVHEGEGPHGAARREIEEEIGLKLTDDEIHLTGIISERAYEGEAHWLMFLFEVLRPIAHQELQWMEFEEGTLEWVPLEDVSALRIPETDREVMWPLVQQHRGGGFFVAHIDCMANDGGLIWTVVESTKRQPANAKRQQVRE